MTAETEFSVVAAQLSNPQASFDVLTQTAHFAVDVTNMSEKEGVISLAFVSYHDNDVWFDTTYAASENV